MPSMYLPKAEFVTSGCALLGRRPTDSLFHCFGEMLESDVYRRDHIIATRA